MPPILNSLLDTDAYKLHMQQAVFHRYPDAEVVAEFHSRNEEDLLPMMGQIEEQLHLAGSLRLTRPELNFLAERPFFTADYLDHLRRKPLDASLLKVFEQDGRINVRVEGPWQDVILWEIPVLAIISEMRNRFRYPQFGVSQALERLDQKIDKLERELSREEMNEFNLIDFGTRRRFSLAVQDAVVGRLKERLPAFRGTSNYLLAQKYGLPAVGTQAHEWFQAHQQLGFPLEHSQRAALTSATSTSSWPAAIRACATTLAIPWCGARRPSATISGSASTPPRRRWCSPMASTSTRRSSCSVTSAVASTPASASAPSSPAICPA